MRHHLIPSPTARNWFQHPAYRRRYAGAQERPFRPAANILETDDTFELSLVAPGRTKEDFKVELEKQTLIIRADQQNDDRQYKRQEFVLKGFERRFELSDSIDTEGIFASYNDGILTLTLPKREEAKKQPARLVDIA